MLSLRYAYVLALVVWLGGMVVAGLVVAPATFGVLQGWNPVEGRVLAGQVFGDVLRRLTLTAYAAGGLMLVSLTVQRLLGPRPIAYGIRAGLVAGMLGIVAYSGLLVSPEIERLQAEVAGPMSVLPPDDARRVRFDTLHVRSTRLLSAAALGGLLLLLWEAREK